MITPALAPFYVWLGCLLPYLNSARQQQLPDATYNKITVFPRTIRYLLVWTLFAICQYCAYQCLYQGNNPIEAWLQVVLLVMWIWPTLIMLSAYWARSFLAVNTTLIGITCCIMLSRFSTSG